MKKLFTVAAILLVSNLARAEITKSKATELGVHRLERLVITNKIHASYQDRFQSLKIEDIPEANLPERFLVSFYQHPLSDGQILWLKLKMNSEGKTLSYETNYISDQHEALLSPVPAWPEKDIVTLTEAALHYVIENGPNKPDIKPFDLNLSSLSSKQTVLADESLRGVFDFRSTDDKKILQLIIKTNGDLDSTQILEE